MSSDYSLLAEVADVIDSSHQTPIYVERGIPMARVTDVKYGALNLGSARQVSIETFRDYSRRYKAKPRDIIISRVGSYGNTAWVVETEFCLGQNVSSISPKTIDARYLFFALNSDLIWSQIESKVVGSTQKTLSLKAIKELKVPRFGEKLEQDIGTLLGVLDDRITLLRETNATLEAIAQALFKSWFVDFDPVHAKQQGRAPEGMDEATAALFPDSFEESELGLVPKGWRLVPFGQLLAHTIGGDWGGDVPDDKNDTRVAIIRGTDIPDLQSGANSRVPIRYTSSKKLASRKLQHGDIVLEVSGGSKDQPTGRSLYLTDGVLGQFDCPVEPASFCRLLRPNSGDLGVLLGKHLAYIYSQGKTWEYQNQSTGIANFQTTHFLETELVVVPSNEVLSEFANTVRPLIDRSHVTQMQALAELRDTLLPRLISGQLRLPDAEAMLDEVGS